MVFNPLSTSDDRVNHIVVYSWNFNQALYKVKKNREIVLCQISGGVIGGAGWAAAPPIFEILLNRGGKNGQNSMFCPPNNSA